MDVTNRDRMDRHQQRRLKRLRQEMQEIQHSCNSIGDISRQNEDGGTLSTSCIAREGQSLPASTSNDGYLKCHNLASAVDARETDIMAVINALQRNKEAPQRDQQGLQEHAASPSPSYTPPERIDYESGVTIVTRPVEPNNEVMRIHFGNSHEFVLTYSEIMRGGPMNSFLQIWNRSEAANDGRPLRFNMPESRSPYLFQVIHDYLRGKDVIPLSTEVASMLCDHYTSMTESYKHLYSEARQYGIYPLMIKVRHYQSQTGLLGAAVSEQFRVYDARTTCPLREEDIDRIAQRAAGHPSRQAGALRVIVVGASINFALRLTEDRTPLLEYSLVAAATAMTHSFNKLYGCLTETLPPQFLLEGSLSREEAQMVKLDVIFNDVTSSCIEDGEPTLTLNKAHYILECALLSLHPSHWEEPPIHLTDTWHWGSFPSLDEDEEDDDDKPHNRFKTQQTPLEKRQVLSKYWLNIPYATISVRFDGRTSNSRRQRVVLESLSTATREVLVSQLPEELRTHYNPKPHLTDL